MINLTMNFSFRGNGPMKNEKSQQILPKSWNLPQPVMVSESQILCVGHI